ncbi:MAG: UDP-galactopyranose mutase [Oscillospiraceae bacterium]|nr:UDP-galactopyranose mutase [Oscillospiraceae bacterium]
MAYDVLIVGAGYAGAVAARRLAEDGGKRVLVLERRPHVGGNAYDCPDAAGILIHQYGPHIFHTNDRRVFDYLSRFTQWRRYQHRVIANLPRDNPEAVPAGKKTGGRFFFPVPFNLDSLKNAFGPEEGERLGQKLLNAYPAQSQVTILELRQNSDPEIAAIADYVYEHVFVHYTMKQWGQTPEEIDPSTTARVPVRLSRDDRYFQDAYQGMPLHGYTPMFEAMLDHPGITVETGVDALSRLELADGAIKLDGQVFTGPVIYTGQADELFGFQFGPLPYRTLDFAYDTLEQDYFQTHGTVNYTVDGDFTRITEFKHLTGQEKPGVTTIMREYSKAYTGAEGEIPYYAIINPANNALYAKYKAQADQYPNLRLLGRLAEYKYYNMDAIAARALALSDELL